MRALGVGLDEIGFDAAHDEGAEGPVGVESDA